MARLRARTPLAVVAFLAVAFTFLPLEAGGATYTVTTTADSGPGSLRQAILDANGSSGADTITFGIGTGLQTIHPTSALPTITGALTIDGWSQGGPSYTGPPLIELAGDSSPAGFALQASAPLTVRGLVIDRFSGTAVQLASGSGGSTVQGNYLGTNAAGTAAAANAGAGVHVSSTGNTIGGASASQRNVISGNDTGIVLLADTNTVTGNYIGTNAAGTAAVGNASDGIVLQAASSNLITNNVISGTLPTSAPGAGIYATSSGPDSSNNVIQGNFIGTDKTGSVALGNSRRGIALNGASSNIIGGSSSGQGNVISGNSGDGIDISAGTGNAVKGNLIGVAANGTSNLGNNGFGLQIQTASNTVGGTASGEGNVIAANNGTGVAITGGSSTGDGILGNQIYGNAGLGIDLGGNGVTANDSGDGDSGPNNLQNFPVITSVVNGTIIGTLDSTPSTAFRVEFFSNAACDASGNGEGARFLGFSNVSTNGAGVATFTASPPLVATGEYVTATATDPANNTSEFSSCVQATAGTTADLGVGLASDHDSTPAIAGDKVTYTATVTNHGPGTNNGYTLAFTVPSGTTVDSASAGCSGSGPVTCTDSGLANGSSKAFTLTLDVAHDYANSSPNSGVALGETATVSSQTPADPIASNDSTTDNVTVVGKADLGVAVSADHSSNATNPAVAGSSATFTATVTNNGPSDNTAFTISLNVPSGTTGTIVAGANCSGTGPITCTHTGAIAPSGSATYQVRLDIAPSYADSAPIAGVMLTESPALSALTPSDEKGNSAPDSTSSNVLVVARADLANAATASPTAHPVAGQTTEDYTVTVTNNGPSDAVGGYATTASLPAGTTLDSGSSSSCSVTSGTITCDRTGIGTLAPNGTDTFHILLDLGPSIGDGPPGTDQTQLTLTVTLGSFGTPQPPSSTGNDTTAPPITVYSEANLSLAKARAPATIYANANGPNNIVTFTLTIANAGPSNAHNVVVNDAVDPTLLTGATSCIGASCSPTTPYTGSVSVGTVAAGTTASVTIAARANPTLGHTSGPAGYRAPGPYTTQNSASVTSSTPAQTSDHRSDGPVSTTIDTVPAPPTLVQFAVPGNANASMEWNLVLPQQNGGTAITGHAVLASPCPGPGTSPCVVWTFSGANGNATLNNTPIYAAVAPNVGPALTNGTTYAFTIVAQNAVGNSDSLNARSTTPSAAAFTSTNTNGTLTADTGFSAGAQTCDPKLVTCNNIVAKYSFGDPNIGAIYNLSAEPNTITLPGLHSLSTGTLIVCQDVQSLDPGKPGYGVFEPSDCGPSDKVIRSTYPLLATGGTPHLESELFDSSISTYTRGAPCFAYNVDKSGTAQCTNPNLAKFYTDPQTGQKANFCPAQYDRNSNVGWTSQKPCAFVYYLSVAIPGFDIVGNGQPIANRPVSCTDTDPNCGKAAVVGSSLTFGITANGKLIVPGWCSKNLAVVPCVQRYLWLNKATGAPAFDVQVEDEDIGDQLKAGGSG